MGSDDDYKHVVASLGIHWSAKLYEERKTVITWAKTYFGQAKEWVDVQVARAKAASRPYAPQNETSISKVSDTHGPATPDEASDNGTSTNQDSTPKPISTEPTKTNETSFIPEIPAIENQDVMSGSLSEGSSDSNETVSSPETSPPIITVTVTKNITITNNVTQDAFTFTTTKIVPTDIIQTPTSTPCHFPFPSLSDSLPVLPNWSGLWWVSLIFAATVLGIVGYFTRRRKWSPVRRWRCRQGGPGSAPGDDDDDSDAPPPRPWIQPTSNRLQADNSALLEQVVAAGRRHLPRIIQRRPGDHIGNETEPTPREAVEATMRGIVDILATDQGTLPPVPEVAPNRRTWYWPVHGGRYRELRATCHNLERQLQEAEAARNDFTSRLHDQEAHTAAVTADNQNNIRALQSRIEVLKGQLDRCLQSKRGGNTGPVSEPSGDAASRPANTDSGLFGSSNTARQQHNNGSFGGSTETGGSGLANDNAGSGFFGKPVETQQQSSSSFGGKPVQSNTDEALFGKPNNTRQTSVPPGQNSTGGGLFGATNNTQQKSSDLFGPPPANTTTGGGLFAVQRPASEQQVPPTSSPQSGVAPNTTSGDASGGAILSTSHSNVRLSTLLSGYPPVHNESSSSSQDNASSGLRLSGIPPTNTSSIETPSSNVVQSKTSSRTPPVQPTSSTSQETSPGTTAVDPAGPSPRSSPSASRSAPSNGEVRAPAQQRQQAEPPVSLPSSPSSADSSVSSVASPESSRPRPSGLNDGNRFGTLSSPPLTDAQEPLATDDGRGDAEAPAPDQTVDTPTAEGETSSDQPAQSSSTGSGGEPPQADAEAASSSIPEREPSAETDDEKSEEPAVDEEKETATEEAEEEEELKGYVFALQDERSRERFGSK